MLVVIAYDSPDDRRRVRIARILEDVADRVQWSVFEGWLTDEQVQETWSRLESAFDPEEDDLRIYRLCSYCRDTVRVTGEKELTRLPAFWIV